MRRSLPAGGGFPTCSAPVEVVKHEQHHGEDHKHGDAGDDALGLHVGGHRKPLSLVLGEDSVDSRLVLTISTA